MSNEPVVWLIGFVIVLAVAIYAAERVKYDDAFGDWLDEWAALWVALMAVGIVGASISAAVILSNLVMS